MNIYPAILTDNLELVKKQLALSAEISDQIAGVQIDVIDGNFADNLTVSPIDLVFVDTHDLPIDFHLMVDEPIDYVYECSQVQGVRAIIAQIEHMTSQLEFIEEVEQSNLKPGLSLDLHTPVESVDDSSWERLKFIQILGNEAGSQGQEFAGDQVLAKIRQVAKIKKDRHLDDLEILVDIGVNETTVNDIKNAGADGAAVGSALWKAKDLNEKVSELI